jgi:hypothetical protein
VTGEEQCLHDGCTVMVRLSAYCARHEFVASAIGERRLGFEAECTGRAVVGFLDGNLATHAPRRHGPMLSDCVIPGCGKLTMGGTCVEHDSPASVTFPRGRPHTSQR